MHAAVRVRRRHMLYVLCSRTGYDHDLPRSSGRHYLLHKFSKSSSCHLRANSMPGRPACPTHTRGLPPATVQRRSARALGSIAVRRHALVPGFHALVPGFLELTR